MTIYYNYKGRILNQKELAKELNIHVTTLYRWFKSGLTYNDILEKQKQCQEKHGLCHTRLYSIYTSMKSRCYYKRNKEYKNYGARGIVICEEWLNSFEAFYSWAMNNGYKDNLTIDRINVNGNYEPNNCRWVTMKIQNNNRRNNHYITYNNETHTVAEWASIKNISSDTIFKRLRNNWSIEKALNTPN